MIKKKRNPSQLDFYSTTGRCNKEADKIKIELRCAVRFGTTFESNLKNKKNKSIFITIDVIIKYQCSLQAE